MHSEAGEFVLVLLHAATNAHLLHLRSKSYAEHMALGTFYEELPGLVDVVAESIQGLKGELLEYPIDYFAPEATALDELLSLQEYVKVERKELPQDSEVQNAIDAIAELINSTVYKLRFLS